MASPAAGSFVDVAHMPLQPKAVVLVTPVTAFYSLALVSVGFRLWAKKIKKEALFFADYAILIAAVFGAGYLALTWLACVRGGVGWPLAVVPYEARELTQISFVVAWLLQTWANSFVRLSILDFLARVFAVRKFRIAVYVMEACSVTYLVVCTIVFFTICRPISYNWSPSPLALEHCGNRNMKFLTSAIFNLILDVGILILPMPMLLNLRLNPRKKVSLMFVFSLGIFVCFATALRIYNVIEFSKISSKLNFTITVIEDALWSGLEIHLGIINACLPVIPPALQWIFKSSLFKYITFSTWRTAKPSKYSYASDRSATLGASTGPQPSWVRLESTKTSRVRVDHSVDVELGSMDRALVENIGSTTRPSASATAYH